MQQDSTVTDLVFKPRTKSKMRWIWELKDRHAGETLFLLGNGWSMRYYDAALMKQTGGVLMGCNRSFERYPLDYLIWQDSGISKCCIKAPCTKLMPHRKRTAFSEGEIDYSTTYFFGFGRYGERNMGSSVELSNSGSLALQMAHYFGFSTIILVGCDCEFIMDDKFTMHSNIFRDAQVKRANHAKKKGAPSAQLLELRRDGKTKYTNKNLMRFAKKFEELYNRFKGSVDIYRMGPHGILRIPSIEYESFWTDQHPDRKKTSP